MSEAVESPLVRLSAYVPEEIYEAVRRMSFEGRRSISDVVREALEGLIGEKGK